jgi:type II secretory pathway component PulF
MEAELSRFGYLLGTLLHAGLPITAALESVSKATTLDRYRQLFDYLRKEVESGQTLHTSLARFRRSRKLVPSTIAQMIAAGEQSGSLSDTLLKIGENFESKMEITMKNLSIILEPLLLVIVWAGVVAVAMAVIFPIYSLIGQFNP